MAHLYKIGQTLEMRSAPSSSNRPSGTCVVIGCLPHEGGPMLYRVKSDGEANERVVEESDLRPSDALISALVERAELFTIAVKKR